MNHQQLTMKVAGRVAALVSSDTRELMTLGQEKDWGFRVLGQAPLPTAPVLLGDWLMSPIHLDSSPIPARTLERVQAIYAAGLRPKGFVVVHEAPKLLGAPAQERQSVLPMSVLPPEVKSALKFAGGALAAIALGVVVISGLVVLAMAAFSIAAILIVPAALVVGIAGVDPILVAVTEDGYWIEIDRWWN